ncbi:MAG: hypothetical protein AYP45_18110 [Candidatus Brocadia carolinensis]|uniref:Uncharacterized protein n=1 Tax=Candidatus Brocadia carolinensis TaxID=1004156 RepID=A0A1V4ANE7_9BACT|nr:MAG: hypothetical protein AYP45_18110 [Candidatus Brocadia caroliniensis]
MFRFGENLSDSSLLLDEQGQHLMATNEPRALGHGDISKDSKACGLSRKTINKESKRFAIETR